MMAGRRPAIVACLQLPVASRQVPVSSLLSWKLEADS